MSRFHFLWRSFQILCVPIFFISLQYYFFLLVLLLLEMQVEWRFPLSSHPMLHNCGPLVICRILGVWGRDVLAVCVMLNKEGTLQFFTHCRTLISCRKEFKRNKHVNLGFVLWDFDERHSLWTTSDFKIWKCIVIIRDELKSKYSIHNNHYGAS